MKQFIRSLIPPILFNLLNRYRNRQYGWHGDYTTWEEAKNTSTGYESNEILQKVKESLLKVKNGEAVYERDSVLFDEIHYSWPLLSGLMLVAAKSNSSLRVLDFGGSLGSTYYQNKKFLDYLDNVTWSVVEQKHFVDIGKKEFGDTRLKFFCDIASCIEDEKPNVLVLASVLQYIEKPYILLDEILKHNFDFILIDRTPFSHQYRDIIKLQTVPPAIYQASYPSWFFDEKYFSEYFTSKKYTLLEIFDTVNENGSNYTLKGMIWRKND